jgi:hypothetical protein
VKLIALVLVSSSTASQAGIREERPNLIGGEILGRGLFFTINYERFLTNSLGLGVGAMGAGTSDGSFFVLSLYASVAPGDIHSAYFSGGITFAAGADANDLESTVIDNLAAGDQYHSESEFYIRPLLSLLIATESTDDFLVWPSIRIGGSF